MIAERFKSDPKFVEKPWGGYIEHFRAEDFSVCYKTLFVEPGHQLSLQYHNQRNELWIISDPQANFELTIGNLCMIKHGPGRVEIPKTCLHTVRNRSSQTLIIYEAQDGICLESDIVRIHDPYHRETKS